MTRIAILAAAVQAVPGEWTTGRARRLYRAAGLAPNRRTARRDLDRLARLGHLAPLDHPTSRAYTRTEAAR